MPDSSDRLAELMACFQAIDSFIPGTSSAVGKLLQLNMPKADSRSLGLWEDAWKAAERRMRTYAEQEIPHAVDPIEELWTDETGRTFLARRWTPFVQQAQDAANGFGAMRQAVAEFRLEVETLNLTIAFNLVSLAVGLIMFISTIVISLGASGLSIAALWAATRQAIEKAASEAVERIGALATDLVNLEFKKIFADVAARAVATRIAGEFFTDVAPKDMAKGLEAGLDTATRKAAPRGASQLRKELKDQLVKQLSEQFMAKGTQDIATGGLQRLAGRGIEDSLARQAMDRLRERLADTTMSRELVRYFGTKAAMGAGFMGGRTLVVEGAEVLNGDRDSIDWGDVGSATAEGLVQGGLMGGHGLVGHVVTGAASGAAVAALGDGFELAGAGLTDGVSGLESAWAGTDLRSDVLDGALGGAAFGALLGGHADGFQENVAVAINERIGRETHLLIDGSDNALGSAPEQNLKIFSSGVRGTSGVHDGPVLLGTDRNVVTRAQAPPAGEEMAEPTGFGGGVPVTPRGLLARGGGVGSELLSVGEDPGLLDVSPGSPSGGARRFLPPEVEDEAGPARVSGTGSKDPSLSRMEAGTRTAVAGSRTRSTTAGPAARDGRGTDGDSVRPVNPPPSRSPETGGGSRSGVPEDSVRRDPQPELNLHDKLDGRRAGAESPAAADSPFGGGQDGTAPDGARRPAASGPRHAEPERAGTPHATPGQPEGAGGPELGLSGGAGEGSPDRDGDGDPAITAVTEQSDVAASDGDGDPVIRGATERSDVTGALSDGDDVSPPVVVVDRPNLRADRVLNGTDPPITAAVEYGRPLTDTGQVVPLFDGPPNRKQVLQGMFNNCGVIAVIRSVGGHRPARITSIVRESPDGWIRVELAEAARDFSHPDGRYYPTGRKIILSVSPEVPTVGDPSRWLSADQTRNGSAWASILEKAFAGIDQTWPPERRTGVDPTWNDGSAPPRLGYERLDSGTWPLGRAEMLTQLTGEPAVIRSFPTDEAAVEAELRTQLDDHKPVLVGSRQVEAGRKLPYGLVAHHMYEVVSLENGQVILENPWGFDHPAAMSVQSFLENVKSEYTTLE